MQEEAELTFSHEHTESTPTDTAILPEEELRADSTSSVQQRRDGEMGPQ